MEKCQCQTWLASVRDNFLSLSLGEKTQISSKQSVRTACNFCCVKDVSMRFVPLDLSLNSAPEKVNG